MSIDMGWDARPMQREQAAKALDGMPLEEVEDKLLVWFAPEDIDWLIEEWWAKIDLPKLPLELGYNARRALLVGFYYGVHRVTSFNNGEPPPARHPGKNPVFGMPYKSEVPTQW